MAKRQSLTEQKAVVLFHSKDSVDIGLFQWSVNMTTMKFLEHIRAEQR